MKAKNIFILFCSMFIIAGQALADGVPFTCYGPGNCGLTLLVSSGLGKNQIIKLKSASKSAHLWFSSLPIELPSPPPGHRFNTVKALARFDGSQNQPTAQIVYKVIEKGKPWAISTCTFNFQVTTKVAPYLLSGSGSCTHDEFDARVVAVDDQSLNIIISPFTAF